MGWTGIYNVPADRKAYVLKDWEFENERVKSEVIAASKVGSVVYAAVKYTYKGDVPKIEEIYEIAADNSIVFAAVILTKVYRGEFMWKDMDETVLPYYFDCPAKIIKLLSPIKAGERGENARKWRETCLASKPTTAKMKVGTVIKFKTPLTFRGNVTDDVFTKTTLTRRGRTQNVFHSRKVGYCRINLKNYHLGEHYEVVATLNKEVHDYFIKP